MYTLLRHKLNDVKDRSKLVGTYILGKNKYIYIYQILSKKHHRIMYNNYNKNLYSNINDVILYLSKLKEKSDDR